MDWVGFFKGQPESGMGYHIADIEFIDGIVKKGIKIYNSSISEDKPIKSIKIVKKGATSDYNIEGIKIFFSAPDPDKGTDETLTIAPDKFAEANFQWIDFQVLFSKEGEEPQYYIYSSPLNPNGSLRAPDKVFESDSDWSPANKNKPSKDVTPGEAKRLFPHVLKGPDLFSKYQTVYINTSSDDKGGTYSSKEFDAKFNNDFYIVLNSKTKELRNPFGKLVGKKGEEKKAMDFSSIAPLLGPGKKLTPEEIARACRLSISAEHDAVHLYELIADAVDEKVAKVFRDIAREEKVHVGEFSRLLKEYDPEDKEALEKGTKEVEEMYEKAVKNAMIGKDYRVLKKDMKKHLEKSFKGLLDPHEKASNEMDMEAAIYWYANNYHEGQDSALYSILSDSNFKPGPTHKSVKDEGDMAEMMYEALEKKYGKSKKAAESGGMDIMKKMIPHRNQNTKYYTNGWGIVRKWVMDQQNRPVEPVDAPDGYDTIQQIDKNPVPVKKS